MEKEGATNSNNLAARAAPCPTSELAAALFKVAFVVLAASLARAPARCHFPNFRHPFVETERESGNRESACSFNLKFWGDGRGRTDSEGERERRRKGESTSLASMLTQLLRLVYQQPDSSVITRTKLKLKRMESSS